MKEIRKQDIERLKIQSYIYRKEMFNNPNTKDPEWIDKLNMNIVESFNFEQRLIDLITKELDSKNEAK